jgi:high-affinity Fe2+/Pb2+ permease
MAITREHDLHKRRSGRNIGLAVVLLAFIALVFGLTIAKVSGGNALQAFDHSYRPVLDPDSVRFQQR